jgi:hypothetical protein
MDIPKLSRAGAQVGDGGYVLHEGVRVAELVEGILIKCQQRTFDEDGVVHNSRNRRLGKVAMIQSDANNRGHTEKLKANQSISLPDKVNVSPRLRDTLAQVTNRIYSKRLTKRASTYKRWMINLCDNSRVRSTGT